MFSFKRIIYIKILIVFFQTHPSFFSQSLFAQNNTAKVSFYLPKHVNCFECARKLEDKGIIKEPWIFIGRCFLESRIVPGKYTFHQNTSIKEILKTITESKKYKVVIPEGYNVCEIIRYLNRQPFLMGAVFDMPQEGSLYPATYEAKYMESRSSVVRKMKENMQKKLYELWLKSDASPSKKIIVNQKVLVTLASVVEKETGTKEERSRVAAVFLNRLSKNMPLQSDPTVIYALTDGKRPLGRKLTRIDTRIESPINTYMNRGLPPKPIACPGMASLKAVLFPDETEELYFVANGEGGHHFGATLDEHNQNVKKWKQSQKDKQVS
jgi:UPF0755 protein